jgi:DNA-binding XRE family transcriptional regulator
MGCPGSRFWDPGITQARTDHDAGSLCERYPGTEELVVRKECRDRAAQIADCIGVDKITITKWEHKGAVPAIRYMPAIIQFLGYNLYPRPAF